MKINTQKLIAVLLVIILIESIPLVAAAPLGTSESAVVEAAKSWIGVKSVHGGNDKSGIDCSHLVFQVYKQAGAKGIEFQTVPNMKKNPYYVNTTSPTPGDVIFWERDVTKNNRNYWLVNHVGIYIGEEQFIDTSFDTKTVAIGSISGVYKEGMPYYARWNPDGSDDTKVPSETPDNNDVIPPVAAFSISPTSGKAPLNVAFIDNSIGATSWSWSFGDGATSTEPNPMHTYSEAGDYTIVLIVNNEKGSSSKTLNMVVQEEPSQEIILPAADFYADITSGPAPLFVQFTDLSQNANQWNWDFGDGTTSTEPNPTHTYSEAGDYTVVLTVSNEDGSKSKTLNIVAQENPSQEIILPAADFYADITSGPAPLFVQFTDLSQNANQWNWDFGDGTTSTEPNPTHTYSSAGDYTVILTVSNENETVSKINLINVLEESSDSDSGSNSGGRSHKSEGGRSGGGGGSPEPAKNVQVKENSQIFISSGKDVTFNFTKNATCVESITFRSTKTVGKTTAIVEELKNKSSLVSELPEGIVYKSFNTWVGNGGYGNSKSIENASVNFKVNTSWVHENSINKSSIILNIYDDKNKDDKNKEWMELPVNLKSEDDQFLHFTANVPGYSFFAITCTKDERDAIVAEPAQTAINSTAGGNASTTADKIAEENKITPGFSIISDIVCLFCVFLYRIKGR
ncbi:MAG: PKD domain-containing protein [Methanosarcina sp.]|jgi:PGF-pre-PGF domain-containing protein|nr:PKD domain-containing protein [Methanosarcina sp.]